jgi:WD40 repeat protein
MSCFQNTNIIKLIFHSLAMFKAKQVFNITNNRLINEIILKILDFKKLINLFGKSKKILNNNDSILSIAYIPERNLLLSCDQYSIKHFDITTYNCIESTTHDESITSLLKLPDDIIVSCGKMIKLWNINSSLECFKTIQIEDCNSLENLFLLSSGSIACISHKISTLIIIKLYANYEYEVSKIDTQHERCMTSVVNLSGYMFASSSADGDIKIWSNNREYLKTLKGHSYVSCLLFLDKENLLLSCANDKTLKVWELIKYECIRTIEIEGKAVQSFLLLPCGYFATGSYEGIIKFWDIKGIKCVRSFRGNLITNLVLLKDYRIASSSYDGSLVILNY